MISYHAHCVIQFKYHWVLSDSNITWCIQKKISLGVVYDITLYNLIDVNIIGFRYREELSDSAITWFCHM